MANHKWSKRCWTKWTASSNQTRLCLWQGIEPSWKRQQEILCLHLTLHLLHFTQLVDDFTLGAREGCPPWAMVQYMQKRVGNTICWVHPIQLTVDKRLRAQGVLRDGILRLEVSCTLNSAAKLRKLM